MPTAAASQIDVTVPVHDPKGGGSRSHLDWARIIARQVREQYHFGKGSQEEYDLEQTAYAELIRKLPGFDPGRVPRGGNPDMLFRGWVKQSIATACKREALRLRNGGTYRTTRTPPRPVADMPDELPDHEPTRLFEFGDVQCRLSGAELTVESEPDLHSWAVAVGELDRQRERSLWMLGDLVVYGVERFGADAWDQLGALGYANETVRKAHRVSTFYPAGIRIPQASWSHHRIACSLPLDKALLLLRRAVREQLSNAALRGIVSPQKAVRRPLLSKRARLKLPAIAERHGTSAEVVLAVLRALRRAV